MRSPARDVPPFVPVRTRKPFEVVVAQIAEAIMAGDLAVGDRLPPERLLAAQMEISRPTLREAEKILVNAGVLEVRGRGTYVITDVVPREVIESGVQMRISEVANVLEARRLLEPNIAQLAAMRATNQDFDYLEHLLELQREHAHDRERMLLLDARFHLALARATHNPLVVSQANLVMRQHEHARDAVVQTPLEIDLVIRSHERIVRAIASGDATEIHRAVDEHLNFFERMWEEVSGRPPLRMPRHDVADASGP